MQNLGLDFARTQQLNAIEQEIAGEQACALGITGRRLKSALLEYRRHRQGGAVPKKLAELRTKISDNLQELLIQRESIGLPDGNAEWVIRTYNIPQEILSKLGLRD
jgi:hypothetical protein